MFQTPIKVHRKRKICFGSPHINKYVKHNPDPIPLDFDYVQIPLNPYMTYDNSKKLSIDDIIVDSYKDTITKRSEKVDLSEDCKSLEDKDCKSLEDKDCKSLEDKDCKSLEDKDCKSLEEWFPPLESIQPLEEIKFEIEEFSLPSSYCRDVVVFNYKGKETIDKVFEVLEDFGLKGKSILTKTISQEITDMTIKKKDFSVRKIIPFEHIFCCFDIVKDASVTVAKVPSYYGYDIELSINGSISGFHVFDYSPTEKYIHIFNNIQCISKTVETDSRIVITKDNSFPFSDDVIITYIKK